MTRTPLSRSPGRFVHRRVGALRQLQQWAWQHVGRGKLLLRCRLLGDARGFGTHGGGEGRGHTVAAARLQLVVIIIIVVKI